VNTLKSAALVVVLLGVLYGVYVVLSKPHLLSQQGPATGPSEEPAPPLVDFSSAGDASTKSADSAEAPLAALSVAPEQPARGGSYQPDLDSPATLPPPSTVPPNHAEPPSDPSLAGSAGATRHSSYESPTPSNTPSAGNDSSAPPLETNPTVTDPSSDAARNAALTAWSLRRDMQAAEQLVGEGKFRDALAILSTYYRHPELTSGDQAQVTPWLDALAAKVIYSREHLLAAPYETRRNETLFDIANRYQVPWMLLQSINGEVVNDPQVLVPGTQLKIVPGPFRADVSLTAGEITLFLGDLYAGRFPFALGNEPPPPGGYKVQDKQANRTYYAADGRTIPANDPSNPYGESWIDLGHEVCIHGSPVAMSGQGSTLGCISLSPQDARDVFGILSVGSDVTIRR
jgi:lipoprotein-anchoring transpeptidase ErfK/SrfK